MMGAKRRKTEVEASTGVNPSDQEHKITAALCERLVRCQDENGNDSSSGKFNLNLDANIPDNIRLAAQQAASILQGAITELQTAIDAAATANGSHVPVASTLEQAKELVAYAHRLSFTTSAPPGFIPGQTPLLHFKPPAPQEIQLRSSALHQFQKDYDLKLKQGQRESAYSAEKKKATTKTALLVGETKEGPAPGPVNLAELLSTLPPMPAGWKPGDPIPGQPPNITEALAASGAAVAVRAAARTAQEKPPSSAPIPPPQAVTAATKPPLPQQQQQQQPTPPAAPIAPAAPSARPASAFDFSLNPDMELEFDVGESSESDEDDSDSD